MCGPCCPVRWWEALRTHVNDAVLERMTRLLQCTYHGSMHASWMGLCSNEILARHTYVLLETCCMLVCGSLGHALNANVLCTFLMMCPRSVRAWALKIVQLARLALRLHLHSSHEWSIFKFRSNTHYYESLAHWSLIGLCACTVNNVECQPCQIFQKKCPTCLVLL